MRHTKGDDSDSVGKPPDGTTAEGLPEDDRRSGSVERNAGRAAIPLDGLPTPIRHWAVAAIGLGIAMSVLDSSIANVALPQIAAALDIDAATAVWIVNGYQIAVVIGLLPLSALGERIGYRKVYLCGLSLFVVGSAGCALANDFGALVLARAVQGLGGGGLMAVNLALIRYIYPRAVLGRGIGLNASIVSAAAAAGPTLAAAILSFGDWPWLFAINVPIGLFNLVIAWHALPRSDISNKPFDWASALLSATAFACFFVAVDTFANSSWAGAHVLSVVCLVIAVVAGSWLVRRSMRREAPLIPLDLLAIPVFALSIGASIAAFSAYSITFVTMPFYLQTVLSESQVTTGLVMTAWPVGLGLTAPIAGRLADRLPASVLGGTGMALMTLSLVLLAVSPVSAPLGWLAACLGLSGCGIGLFLSPNNRTMIAATPRERAGGASGMQSTARIVGMTTGASIAGLAFHLLGQDAEPTLLAGAAFLPMVAGVLSVSRLKAGR